jgi:hypothetical protein
MLNACEPRPTNVDQIRGRQIRMTSQASKSISRENTMEAEDNANSLDLDGVDDTNPLSSFIPLELEAGPGDRVPILGHDRSTHTCKTRPSTSR